MKEVLAELKVRNAPLFFTGLFNLLLGLAMLFGVGLDDRTILGINPWIKPSKFAFSIVIFTWTVAWISGYVRTAHPRAVRAIGRVISAAMLIEIAAIAGQSLRGVGSHFNSRTPFDGIVFGVMGIMILLSSLAVVALFKLFVTTKIELPAPYILGLRLGILIFIVGSFEGGAMLINRAHTVGLPDGGPGLPLVNWSTRAGDLRISHFLGLHALQFIPWAGWLLRRKSGGSRWVAVFSAGYFGAMVALFAWAVLGRPLWAR